MSSHRSTTITTAVTNVNNGGLFTSLQCKQNAPSRRAPIKPRPPRVVPDGKQSLTAELKNKYVIRYHEAHTVSIKQLVKEQLLSDNMGSEFIDTLITHVIKI